MNKKLIISILMSLASLVYLDSSARMGGRGRMGGGGGAIRTHPQNIGKGSGIARIGNVRPMPSLAHIGQGPADLGRGRPIHHDFAGKRLHPENFDRHWPDRRWPRPILPIPVIYSNYDTYTDYTTPVYTTSTSSALDNLGYNYWVISNNTTNILTITSDTSTITLYPGTQQSLYRSGSFWLSIQADDGSKKDISVNNHNINISGNLQINT